jgi:hypothetical protein
MLITKHYTSISLRLGVSAVKNKKATPENRDGL